ncbi:MAG TPA: cytochrome c family protein [Acetobacteraceae bacterium]|nr:cytochrome c family protein [Acetobacteraceae bacterium]
MSCWTVVCLLLIAGTASTAWAQLPFEVPKPTAPTTVNLLVSQCGTCHTMEPNAPPRQGPNLAGVFLRQAGAVPSFHYSPGFAHATFIWDEAHLDAWLTNPQKLIPGAVMVYRQANPAIRASIIALLKEGH